MHQQLSTHSDASPDAVEAPEKPKTFVLVDGYGFVFRAYHSVPSLQRSDGTPVGAVYGFTSMLVRLLTDLKPSYIGVLFDSGQKNFRHDLYDAYKANRPPAPEDLKVQLPIVREATKALGLMGVEEKGYEADDIIATYVRLIKEQGDEVIIVSSDKDLMQLVEPGVRMLDPVKNIFITEKEVEEKFGVPPAQVLDVLSLMGDSADNIPGVPGIGPKIAAELIQTYGSLDNLLQHTDEIKQKKRRENLTLHQDDAHLSRRLITLENQVPVNTKPEELAFSEPNQDVLQTFLAEQDFHSLMQKTKKVFSGSHTSTASVSTSKPQKTAKQKETSLSLITSVEELSSWIKEHIAYETASVAFHPVSLDEKAAKKAITAWHDDIAIAVVTSSGDACLIPIASPQAEEETLDLLSEEPQQATIPKEAAINALSSILANPSIRIIAHDSKAFFHYFKGLSKTITALDDLHLMAYLLHASDSDYQIDTLLLKYASEDSNHQLNIKNKEEAIKLLQEDNLNSSCNIIEKTQALHTSLRQKLGEEKMLTLYERLELPLSRILMQIEQEGVLLDPIKLHQLSEEFTTRLSALEQSIYRTVGTDEFNIGSPKQLGEMLFDYMGLTPKRKKTKTGHHTTSAEVLEELSAEGHTVADDLLEWRQLSKLKSTYTDALLKQLNPETKRVHTHFSMTTTNTGRLSSNHPNLQNIPIRTAEGNKIREAFIAKPGYKLISADYSQIELRLLAHVADIEALKTAFKEEQDIHALTASQVFNIPLEDMDPMVRRRAKAINFGIIYGISPFGLARQLGIDRTTAASYINTYFERYPGISRYMEKMKEFAHSHHYVETLMGRKCYIPSIQDKNPMRRQFAERAAINAPLQGTAADIIKKAMVALTCALDGMDATMILQVHDELLFEVADTEVEKISPLIRRVMENVIQLDVPLTVSLESGTNWAEIH